MNDEKTVKAKAPVPVNSGKVMLSKNFSLQELCVTKSSAPNVPGDKETANLKLLAELVLQPIRDHFNKAVIINSAYRSPFVNAEAGGAANSQHQTGQAADIEIAGVPNEEIWHFIVDPKNKIPFDQVIAEHLSAIDGSKGWIHVSFSATQQRKNAISCITLGRQVKYVPGLVFES